MLQKANTNDSTAYTGLRAVITHDAANTANAANT
jgi:hypothetical protein